MKNKLYITVVVLVVFSVLLGGCGANDTVCQFLKNCYFESPNTATFFDVNAITDYSLIPVNAYIEKIGEFCGKQLVSDEAVKNLLLLQESEMKTDDLSQKNLNVLEGDLLFESSDRNFFKNLSPSLKIYLGKLNENFVSKYKNGELPDESDIHALSYYEKLLFLMKNTKIFNQDVTLTKEFENDSYFEKDKIFSQGIFITSALNFLILRARVSDSQFYPLPFSTKLIQKREKQLTEAKNALLFDGINSPDSYKLFAIETFVNFSSAFNGIRIINKNDKAEIEKYFKMAISDRGLFNSENSLTDSIFNTFLAAEISKKLNLNSSWSKKTVYFIENLNKDSDGVFVVYDKIYFNPWDTYRALFIAKERCKTRLSKMYNYNKLKEAIISYLKYPESHMFEENYYAEKSALMLNLPISKDLKQYLSTYSDFSKNSVQDIYFYLLLAKLSGISVQNKRKTISAALYRTLPLIKNNIHFMVKAYLSLRMLDINDESLASEIEKEIESGKPNDIRSLYYEYLFARSTNNKSLGNTCVRKLKDFECGQTGLYCMTEVEKTLSLAATCYAYEILYSVLP